VTCANRKTVEPAPALTLRAVPRSPVTARCRAWIRRLKAAATTPSTPAEDLYAGDHWQVVRSLRTLLKGDNLSVSVWIVSAGYGLIPLHAGIRPYSATFSSNHPDSVVLEEHDDSPAKARRAWWKTLAEWDGPAPGHARMIAALASEQKDIAFLVAASPTYLDAFADDLEAARQALPNPERLAVFSAGSEKPASLPANFIPCDARLRHLLGGSLGSLNVRCIRYALEKLNGDLPSVTGLRTLFTRALRRQPVLPTYTREPLSDEQVCAFIRSALAEDAELRPTPLLRRLRDSGRACEQARFTALFRKVERGGPWLSGESAS
jgi:hypothetical protein